MIENARGREVVAICSKVLNSFQTTKEISEIHNESFSGQGYEHPDLKYYKVFEVQDSFSWI